MKYKNLVTARYIFSGIVTLIGLPAFIILEGNLYFFLAATLYGLVINNFAQIGYHRWLCHNHFEPSSWARKFLLACITISGMGPPGHHVVAHINHHAKTDTPEDTHSPKYLSFWQIFLGRYNTPKHIKAMQLRNFMRQKDAVFVNENYWKLYILSAFIHCLVSPWLLIWLGFGYFHGFFAFNVQNYWGHSGKKGKPTELHPVVNFMMLGEGLHSHHHHKPQDAIFGEQDWGGKYIVPLLKNK